MPNSQLSSIPWRKEGIRYANNEAYFDCIEELDAIIDKNGQVITCEIQGYVSPALWLFNVLLRRLAHRPISQSHFNPV